MLGSNCPYRHEYREIRMIHRYYYTTELIKKERIDFQDDAYLKIDESLDTDKMTEHDKMKRLPIFK